MCDGERRRGNGRRTTTRTMGFGKTRSGDKQISWTTHWRRNKSSIINGQQLECWRWKSSDCSFLFLSFFSFPRRSPSLIDLIVDFFGLNDDDELDVITFLFIPFFTLIIVVVFDAETKREDNRDKVVQRRGELDCSSGSNRRSDDLGHEMDVESNDEDGRRTSKQNLFSFLV